ncbi:DUF1919 domain-containing protein [Photobacterium carnosum]|uniref:DUF1919 domain-containing protein n=1 Tax=Photobacterium carnosum TaxID=2023717 RepID=UPI001E429264|nr:DUF1919 domain-containing protein [Photobacterium carnosum]MCD9546750.1 DUF1919 domain-containing protein [Photobacterium carnosum]
MKRIFKYIYRKSIFQFIRKIVKFKYKYQTTTNNLSIISSNCLAGCIYSDLGKEFLSPTINTFFYAECFIKFCEHLDYYLSLDLKEAKYSKYIDKTDYPVGVLDNIEIHFLHYSSFADAYEKWNNRKKKVNYNNIRFLMTDRDGFNKNIGSRFDLLPGKKNIIFTANKYYLQDEVYCKLEKGIISSDFTSFRKYEKYINIVDWFDEK